MSRSKIQNRIQLIKNITNPFTLLRILKLCRRAIIIGGCGRSGTSLLLSILSCHPQIYAIEIETNALCSGGYDTKPDLSKPLNINFIYKYLFTRSIPKSCKFWCEKSPKNVLFLGQILKYFGNRVRFLHIVRDGRDVILSRHPQNPSIFWVSPQRYVQDVKAGLLYEKHPQVFTVRYEDIIFNYEKTIKKICLFIGVSFIDAFFSFPESSNIKQHLAWSNPAQVISDGSIGKWKYPQYKKFVENFIKYPGVIEILRHFNYIDSL